MIISGHKYPVERKRVLTVEHLAHVCLNLFETTEIDLGRFTTISQMWTKADLVVFATTWVCLLKVECSSPCAQRNVQRVAYSPIIMYNQKNCLSNGIINIIAIGLAWLGYGYGQMALDWQMPKRSIVSFFRVVCPWIPKQKSARSEDEGVLLWINSGYNTKKSAGQFGFLLHMKTSQKSSLQDLRDKVNPYDGHGAAYWQESVPQAVQAPLDFRNRRGWCAPVTCALLWRFA